jgi:hypothetical protein
LFTKIFLSTAVLLVFAGSVAMQTAAINPEPRKAEVKSYQFKLEERDGKCHLVYEGRHKGDITLNIAPPCEFARDHKGKAQHFQYRRKGGTRAYDVILVLGGPVNKARSDKLMPEGCATKMQAVSMNSTGVVAGDVGSVLITCPLEGLDEKFFGTLAKPM